jgi:homoserine kinase
MTLDLKDFARSVEVRVPASTSNLGSGFDCCGLALNLYLTVRASINPCGVPCIVETFDERDSNIIPRDQENLIYKAMRLVAEREGFELPPVRLEIENEIPFASGLGSSGAAIVAGLSLFSELMEQELSVEKLLRYATELEGHADNVAAALLGSLVINCTKEDGEVLGVKCPWPRDIKVIAVSPQFQVVTKFARSILPDSVSRRDLVYNLQRVALFGAAFLNGDYELLWEAMKDQVHQPLRAQLVPGLREALDTTKMTGLLGIALSGSGPTVVALATTNFEEIGQRIASAFHERQLATTIRILEVETEGVKTKMGPRIELAKSGAGVNQPHF